MKKTLHVYAFSIVILQICFCLELSAQTTSTCNQLGGNLSQNLIAFYPFCGNANDISGNGINPTFNNATLTTDRFGNANSAYYFDGTQYIKGSSSYLAENTRTVAIFLCLDDNYHHDEILGIAGGCGSSFFMGLNFTNHPG